MERKLQKSIKCALLLFIAIILLNISARAQTLKIVGKVTSADNSQPMAGVNIKVKGAASGTVSAPDGSYTISAVPGNVIVFSFLGYASQQVTIKTASTINVKLSTTSSDLNEVVVIGYGKSRRKDVTGSISSIKGDDLRQTLPTTFDQALQGKVAGVVVQQISGQPGGGVSIQIRGVSSITGSNSPLYVIDGVIIPPVSDPGSGGNPLNSINPADIETIDVLKDASATAIYGSQATNGVVVITTKRGKVGAPTVSYDFYQGDQEIPKELPTMNLQQYATFLNARSIVWGFATKYDEFVNPQYLGLGTNWQKELFRRAPMSSHTVTISGGDTKTRYLLSGSYFDQQGIAIGSYFKRISTRINLDNNTTNWLKVGLSLELDHVNQNQNTTASGVISSALSLTPDVPVQNSDGSWGGITDTEGWVPGIVNPVAIAEIVTNVSTRNQAFGNAYAEIQFTRDLSFRTEVSGNFDFGAQNYFSPQYTFGKVVNGINSGSSNMSQNIYTVLRNFATYNHNFSKFYLNILAGHEAQSTSFSESIGAARSNYPSNNVISINSGDPTTATNSGAWGKGGASESYFGRVNFSWADKYLLTGNIRDDGSSSFPINNRWGLTYSGAFAWKINNEDFLKGVKEINELKLRLGYGLTNNQNIPGNTYVTQLTTVANGLTGIAQFQSNLPNPNVTWEKTNYYNAGIDGTFFNGRINFSLDVYDRETNGLLLAEPLPLYSGTSAGFSPGSMAAPYANVGSMRNRGVDLHISTTNISRKDFSWKSDFTISRNINKVLSLGNGGSDASLTQTSYTNNEVTEKTVVGQPIGEFYGYVFDGIFSTAKDFKTHALPADQSGKPYPISPSGGGIWYGDRMFKDLNGDGIIDSRDQTFLGSPIPKFQYGINNSIVYKNFDLNFFFSGDYGNKVFNQMSITQTNPIASTAYFASVLNYAHLALVNPAGSASDVNNVYVTNPNTTIVGLRNDNTNDNTRSSNLYIQDGSFLKCKNITLGYRLPENILSKIYVHSIRVYATVTNVFTITKYQGMDPEIGSWNPLQNGWDSGYYPQPRVYTVGANITFNK